jgi:hypothetical protein
MPEKPDADLFHDCELAPDAILGKHTFEDACSPTRRKPR